MTSENAIAEIRQLSLEVGNAKIDYLERIADLNKWAGLTAVCTTLFVGGFVGSSLSVLSGSIALYNNYRIDRLERRQETINNII